MLPEHAQNMSVTPPLPLDQEIRRRAVLAVCARAVDVNDADDLLEALGLDPREGRPIPRVSD